MGIALFTLSSLFDLIAPLQAFFMGHPGRRPAAARGFTQARPAAAGSATCARQPSPSAKVRPLRVVRVVEPQEPRTCAGRMVISGRMADVCAELDRLAAIEAAAQSSAQAAGPAR